MSDHPQPAQMGHGYGETPEQHARHSSIPLTKHFGLPPYTEAALFYIWAFSSWLLEIAASVCGSYFSTGDYRFIATATPCMFCSWAAWLQTAIQMMQRASWVRDESNLVDRRRYLYLAVRLQRLMLPTALIALVTFIVAYVRRMDTDDVGNWLFFLLVFIFNIVGCVMNAYNNITWESDRLEYEEGSSPYGNTLLSILGIPSEPSKEQEYKE
ncbi:uncharacterized protein LTR77_005984 [Saxophila tyrrhenica]|uniref:Uncharacterized protein n=1 Tax=Saxophila tyrrhenica TaxID=1690608 RepID=A0AAV9P7B1_9PEZI|nr:hypothetical protein LTR77_005984 [Saxophila tyrrhenica]